MMKKLEAMSLPYLPQHLVVQILSNLPVKSLLRFKYVSKPWHSLISNPYFIKTHLNQPLTHRLFISKSLRPPFGLYTASFRSADAANDDSIVVAKMDFLFESNQGSQIRGCEIIGSCNGLICMAVQSLLISDRYSPLNLKVYVFNLSTRESRLIPDCDCPGYTVGFGYDHCHDDYKLVNIRRSRISVYSMRLGYWSIVEDFPPKSVDFFVFSCGTQLNGVLHWLCLQNLDVSDISRRTFEIAAFCLVDEKLWTIPFPSTTSSTNFHKTKQVGVFEGCLCILPRCDDGAALWVMKEYGVKQSWTKIDIKVPIFSDMLTLLRNQALLDYTKFVLYSRYYNRPGKNWDPFVVIHDDEKGEVADFHAIICVDSLLSPFMNVNE